MLADQPGVFPLSLEWITDDRVPKIVCQPFVALVMDRLRAKVNLSPLVFPGALVLDRLCASVASKTFPYWQLRCRRAGF